MNRRLRGSDWPLNAPDLNVRRGHSLVRVRSLGPVQSASSHKVGEDGHEVQTMYPSEVSATGAGFAEFEDSACRNVWSCDYYRDGVAGVESVSNGCRVVGCERNIVGSNIYLVDDVDARGIGDTLDQGCSGDTGASKIKHRLEAWQRGTRPCASCQDDICRFLAIICAFLIERMLSQSLM